MTGVMERSESQRRMRGALYPCHRAGVSRTASPGGAPAVARRSSSRVAGRPKPALPAAARCHRLGDGFSSPSRRGSGPARLRSPFFSARSGASGADVGAIDAPGVPVDPASSSSCRRSTARMRAKVPSCSSGENGRRRLPRAVAFRQIAPAAPCSTSRTSRPATRGAAHCPPRPPFAGKIGSTRRHWASLNHDEIQPKDQPSILFYKPENTWEESQVIRQTLPSQACASGSDPDANTCPSA